MKKILTFIILGVFIIGIVGCNQKSEAEVKIDLGTSTIYTNEDMEKAILKIKEEFNSWEGCKLHSISYAGDESSNAENLKWMNDLRESKGIEEKFTQCIMFKSNFHSPVNGGGAWNPNEEYVDWQWWLARVKDGDWELITWGY